MTYLPTLINALIVAGIGVLITFVTRTQIAEMKEDAREFRSEMRSEFRDIRAEIAALRSDLTQVALAVGVQPRPHAG